MRESKSVLCFGDSNTYGSNPNGQQRFPRDIRWTGRLQKMLGEGYYIIEEGCPGRTAVYDDPIEEYKNGKEYLIPCLYSHMPLDLVIIMLGTNDCKMRFNLPAYDIAWSMENLIQTVKTTGMLYGSTPQILLMAPVPLEERGWLGEIFIGGAAKSRELGERFKGIAQKLDVHFMDAGEAVTWIGDDGVHLDESGHEALAQKIYEKVQEILK